MPQAADRECDLKMLVSIAVAAPIGRDGDWFWRGGYLRFIRVQTGMATTAKIVSGPELDQETAITSHHFPRVYGCESRCHPVVGVPERALTSLARDTPRPKLRVM